MRRLCLFIIISMVILIMSVSVFGQTITLQLWDVFDPVTSPDARAREELLKQYEEENPGIKIEHNVIVYADLHDKAVVSGAAGSGPDILHMLGEWIPEFSMMGIIEDVTDKVNSWEDKQYFPDSTWDVAFYNGHCYGIPSIASPRVLLYRKDYFDSVGITNAPTTWDEMKEDAQKLTRDTTGDGKPDVYGFAFCSSSDAIRGPQEFLPFLWQTGAEWVIKENEIWKPGFTIDQAQEVFQLYYDLVHTLNVCPPDSIGWGYLEMDNAFVVGQTAMCHNGSWMQHYEEKSGEIFKNWRGAKMPANENSATYFEVKVEGIGKFSKNKEEAWKLLTWLLAKDQMAKHTAGDNLPSRTDVISLPQFQEDTFKKPFLEAISDGKPFPKLPMAESNKLMMNELQTVLYQKKTPEQAAQDLLKGLENILISVNE
ncbi:hypothetical protein CVT91_03225 [Candidatus Atribacteria bacterium HGW-Atribacteria-1]|nr:MAG: hypothetical protein CVT91_03225 [Candidatus Atribacteria bacterium HGW-Atribacteria-1]